MPDYSVREQRGWYMYDFANSAFSTTVVTVFMGPYLTAITKSAADAAGYVHPLGIPVYAPSFYSYMVALSVILQVLVLPIVGAIADYGRRKKEVLAATAYFGAAATMAMFFVAGQRLCFRWIVVRDREPHLRRFAGDLQFIPAGNRAAGTARRLFRRRDSLSAISAAVFCSR